MEIFIKRLFMYNFEKVISSGLTVSKLAWVVICAKYKTLKKSCERERLNINSDNAIVHSFLNCSSSE